MGFGTRPVYSLSGGYGGRMSETREQSTTRRSALVYSLMRTEILQATIKHSAHLTSYGLLFCNQCEVFHFTMKLAPVSCPVPRTRASLYEWCTFLKIGTYPTTPEHVICSSSFTALISGFNRLLWLEWYGLLEAIFIM